MLEYLSSAVNPQFIANFMGTYQILTRQLDAFIIKRYCDAIFIPYRLLKKVDKDTFNELSTLLLHFEYKWLASRALRSFFTGPDSSVNPKFVSYTQRISSCFVSQRDQEDRMFSSPLCNKVTD